MQITLTPLSQDGVTVLAPDIVWEGGAGDFALAESPQDGGVGGFVAADSLASAVYMLMFTDAQADPDDPAFGASDDRRGWVGDGFGLDPINGMGPLGSRLWTFRRSEPDGRMLTELAGEVKRALHPLVLQGIIDRIEVTAEFLPWAGQLRLSVSLIRANASVYTNEYALMWNASRA